jgi:hypothetical protein
MHNNSVEAGFVSRTGDWIWSSARDYAEEGKGPIECFLSSNSASKVVVADTTTREVCE